VRERWRNIRRRKIVILENVFPLSCAAAWVFHFALAPTREFSRNLSEKDRSMSPALVLRTALVL
jgi:hypothetical protein